MNLTSCISILTVLATHLVLAESVPSEKGLEKAMQSINGESMLNHIKTLSSDDFEGRSPGTKGEKLTVDYVESQFKKLGLKPGNPKGGYKQSVPLIVVESTPTVSVKTASKTIDLKSPDEFVGFSISSEKKIDIKNSELVFVGYGVVAPEYGWDDYKGIDLKGKTMVMLINDPAIIDPKNAEKLDDKMFGGDAMTYYGRWTYKYEMAAKMGAAAAIIIHEVKAAAYPFEVVKNSWGRENFAIRSKTKSKDFPSVSSWIRNDKGRELLLASGHDFDALKKAALSKDFKPVNLGSTINISVQNKIRTIDSSNVIAKIEGSDPKLKKEYILYTAHWDHLGMNETLPGPKSNQIYHGALDNASGMGALLELAKAFKNLPKSTKRTVLFMATSAEERGLLGAKYYATHPLYPLNKTLANINIDGINVWGKTSDFEMIGFGKSTMDEFAQKAASKQNRVIVKETRPEFGIFYRADHFEFAKQGVPSLFGSGGDQYIGQAKDYARKKVDEYAAKDYHKVTDTVRSDWDMAGAVEDTQLLFDVGYDLTETNKYPEWNVGAEFKAIRDASMKSKK